MPDWLDDLALESIAPPPVWLPSRAERLADARTILARRFGRRRDAGVRPSHGLRDTILIGGGVRYVTGHEIEAEMELELTTINPPIAQGWIVALLVVTGTLAAGGVPAVIAAPASDLPEAIARAIGPLVVAVGLIVLAAMRQRSIELDVGGVRVRSWLDRWLRRPGLRLGPPESIQARLRSRLRLEIEARPRRMAISLALWPHTARQDLVDELPMWGVECEFGPHRHRPERSRRHRRRRGGGS